MLKNEHCTRTYMPGALQFIGRYVKRDGRKIFRCRNQAVDPGMRPIKSR
jgi:hypothetical protein